MLWHRDLAEGVIRVSAVFRVNCIKNIVLKQKDNHSKFIYLIILVSYTLVYLSAKLESVKNIKLKRKYSILIQF